MGAALRLTDVEVRLADAERRFTLSIPDVTLRQGDVVGLTGPSGTGKTMLLEVLGLLRRPMAGQYVLEDGNERLDLMGRFKDAPFIRGQRFGFVPQSGGLLPFLSVLDNVMLSQRIADHAEPAWGESLLHRLGLADLGALMPAALSIGQRQRVAIARALAHRPSFVIADEPTAALDPEAAENAMSLLLDAARDGGAGVIISSHDHDLLERFELSRLDLTLSRNDDGVVSTVRESVPA